jgi:hypothetical protein
MGRRLKANGSQRESNIMHNLSKWVGAPLPMDGWAYGDVTWVAGAVEGSAVYAKTKEGIWYSVTPIGSHKADVPVRVTDDSLIAELEAFTA